MHVVLSGRIRAELRLCPQASHPTVHPHLSAFYLHPADLLPSPSSLLPSTFIFFFLASPHHLHLPCICCLFISHSTPSIQPPPPTPPPPPPPSRWRPHTDRSADSLVVSHFRSAQTAAAEAAGGAETVIPPQSHTPHPTPPHPTEKPVAGGGGAQPRGTPVLLDPLFSVFVKPDFFSFLKDLNSHPKKKKKKNRGG